MSVALHDMQKIMQNLNCNNLSRIKRWRPVFMKGYCKVSNTARIPNRRDPVYTRLLAPRRPRFIIFKFRNSLRVAPRAPRPTLTAALGWVWQQAVPPVQAWTRMRSLRASGLRGPHPARASAARVRPWSQLGRARSRRNRADPRGPAVRGLNKTEMPERSSRYASLLSGSAHSTPQIRIASL
jgi:hypothetical protein